MENSSRLRCEKAPSKFVKFLKVFLFIFVGIPAGLYILLIIIGKMF